jgi:hypothetical protein
VTKQRDLPKGQTFAFKLATLVIATDRRGKPITSCVVQPAEAPVKGKSGGKGLPRKAEQALTELKTMLAEQDAGAGDLSDLETPRLSTGQTSVDAWRARVADKGLIGGARARQDWYEIKAALTKAGIVFEEDGLAGLCDG